MNNLLYEFKSSGFKPLMIPWIFFPIVTAYNLFLGILLLVVASLSFYILTKKTILFNQDNILIEKYRWWFKKNKSINYNDVSFIYINVVTMSVTYGSTFIINLKTSNETEKISIQKFLIKPFKKDMESKGLNVKISNRDFLST